MWLLLLLLALGVGRAHGDLPYGYRVQSVDPTINPYDFVFLQQTQTTKAWHPVIGAFLHYAHDPLFLSNKDTKIFLVNNRLQLDVGALIPFSRWVELGVYFPVTLYQQPNSLEALGEERPLHTLARGDVHVDVKIPLKQRSRTTQGWGLALAGRVFFPSGEKTEFSSDGQVTGHPTVIIDGRTSFGLVLAAQTGVYIRPLSQVGETVVAGSTWNLALGGEIPLPKIPQLLALGSLSTQVPLLVPNPASQISGEGMVGLRWRREDWGFSAVLAGAVGIHCTPGTPLFRVFAGISWDFLTTKQHAEPPPPPLPPIPPPPPPPPPVIICEQGQTLHISDKVYFATNQDTLEDRSFVVLDQVAAYLHAHPEIKWLLVEGHTDDRGSDEHNLDLSQRRANTVMQYLLEHGIEPSRLEAQGFGRSHPRVPNRTPADMDQNRRVAFTILSREPSSQPNHCQ